MTPLKVLLWYRVCGTRHWPAAVTGSSFCPINRAKLPCGVEKNARSNSCLAHFESLSLAPPDPSAEVETASSSLMTMVVVSTMQAVGDVVENNAKRLNERTQGAAVGSRLVVPTTSYLQAQQHLRRHGAMGRCRCHAKGERHKTPPAVHSTHGIWARVRCLRALSPSMFAKLREASRLRKEQCSSIQVGL